MLKNRLRFKQKQPIPLPAPLARQPHLPASFLKTSRFVCLILTCQKPPYILRRAKQVKTIALLLKYQFEVYYVLGGATAGLVVHVNFAHGIPALQVPGAEHYEHLSARMGAAFNYFLDQKDLVGILKIDDDTEILSDQFCREVQQLRTDYAGGQWCSSPDTRNRQHQERCEDPIWNRALTEFPNGYTWFGGPCYYVSQKALHRIRVYGLRTILEDVSVGEAIRTAGAALTTSKPEWRARQLVAWPEVYGIAPVPSRRLLTCQLKGGLGNRLFAIATGLALAYQWSMDFVFAPDLIKDNAHRPEQACCWAIVGLSPQHRVVSAGLSWTPWVEPAGKEFTYLPFPTQPPAGNNICLQGYFLSPKYFTASVWLPTLPPPRAYHFTGYPAQLHKACFIHVRLGDYRQPLYAVNLVQYYKKAVDHVRQHFPSAPLWLFSNEPEAALLYLTQEVQITDILVAPVTPEFTDAETLWLMSQCRSGICAHSTFSFWAAYIGVTQHPERSPYYYMPNTWLTDKSICTQDILPTWATIVTTD